MPARTTSVLVVDDDMRIVRMVQRIMELEGYNVMSAPDGESALDLLDKETPDLVLVDIMMPGMDGYTLCKRIREFSQVPIIIVTARGDDDEKVEGLDAGADDYICKPFSSKELAARVRAALRRARFSSERSDEAPFSTGNLVIDFAQHRVRLGDREMALTPTEFNLLSYLAHNAGRVLTPDQILATIWGEDYIGEHELLRVAIARLRQKLEEDSRNPRFVLTRHGIGYTMEKP
ncbi:MAG: response regulator transcription factor [Chloroflexi bacterium]|nr:response regulator transcription factor [Chloroflexota bacterium]